MKRSELNQIMRDALAYIEEMNFKLPPFVYFTYEDWKTKGAEYAEIPDNLMGWDITDFGSGDFYKSGLIMITVRNGSNNAKYPKSYGEKIFVCEEGQITPYHTHGRKLEDLVNRGGGTFVVSCFKTDSNGKKLEEPFPVSIDGKRIVVKPEERIYLLPGESMLVEPGVYHSFWAEGGKALVGEVSDYEDYNDDTFYDDFELSMELIEDEPILYPLFTEIPKLV